ncbi:MAG: nucleotidyltransferase family protein [Candidatus Heimdallarchaeota archaeon]
MEISIGEVQQKIIPVLKRHGVLRAALFGSLISGKMKEDSDIDLLIELGQGKSLLDLVALKLELEEVLGRKVDVVEYVTIHPLLKERILSEQVPVL